MSETKTTTHKNKISQESAEAQMKKFFDYYDFDIEEDVLNSAARNAVKTAAQRIKKAIRKGLVEIEDVEGIKVSQTVKGEKISYKELDGHCKITSDKYEGEYAKIYAMAGYLTGLGLEGIKELKGKDLSIAESIGMLFLQI